MKNLNRGFTLIELVVVIVLLGILSAVAIPKYIDYKSIASIAAAKGVAAALSAASETNYAAFLIGSTAYIPNAGCVNAMTLLNGRSPPGYSTEGNSTTIASTSNTQKSLDQNAASANADSAVDAARLVVNGFSVVPSSSDPNYSDYQNATSTLQSKIQAAGNAKTAANTATTIAADSKNAAKLVASICVLRGPAPDITTEFMVIPVS